MEEVVEEAEVAVELAKIVKLSKISKLVKIFEYLKPEAIGLDNELWLQDANDKVSKNGVVRVYEVDGEWMTTGDPIRYMRSHIKFMLRDKEYGPQLANLTNLFFKFSLNESSRSSPVIFS